MIPAEVREAFDRLKESGLVDVTTDLEPTGFGAAKFRCLVPIPQPNAEDLPRQVELEAQVPAQFPNGKVAFKPTNGVLVGFPHQASENAGAELCLLASESDYPWEPTERLQAYTQSAIDWCEDAARGELLKDGEPWELPDFGISPTSAAPSVIFAESEATHAEWTPHIGRNGTVELAEHVHKKGLVPVAFRAGNDVVHTASIATSFADTRTTSTATWVLLPSFIYERHRPPQTFGELQELCEATNIDLSRCLRRALKARPVQGYHFLLVGAPIPEKVGEDATEIHWQPIALSHTEVEALLKTFRGSRKNGQFLAGALTRMLKGRAVPWSKSTNVGGKRLLARGVLHEDTRRKRICVLGCGAIGSTVAEYLVRGGVHDVRLYDFDDVELPNLPRHTLSAADLGANKATALARRLCGIYPESTVVGYPCRVPIEMKKYELIRAAQAALADADVLIDCTTSESAFRWASAFASRAGKTLLHIFINAHARMLTIVTSGRHIACQSVLNKLGADIQAGAAGFTMKDYDPDDGGIEPGAGCWHPSFSGRGADIAALVTSIVPQLEHLIRRPRQSRGTAIVVRRHTVTEPRSVQPLVETAFVRDYR